MLKEKTREEVKKYQDEVVLPLAGQTGNLFLNMRYNALAALSMRLYVAGRLYVMLKPRYIMKPDDPAYVEFLSNDASGLGYSITFVMVMNGLDYFIQQLTIPNPTTPIDIKRIK
jgi:hypothetical protein